MLWRTHFLAGMAAGLMVSGAPDLKSSLVPAAVAGVAALLPDLDDPHSKLGRLVVPASWVVKMSVGHRGPLHSLIASAGAFLLALALARGDVALAVAAAAGYVSHLAADSLNPQGVPWLWPWAGRFGLPLVQTGSLVEKLAVIPLALLSVAWELLKKL